MNFRFGVFRKIEMGKERRRDRLFFFALFFKKKTRGKSFLRKIQRKRREKKPFILGGNARKRKAETANEGEFLCFAMKKKRRDER